MIDRILRSRRKPLGCLFLMPGRGGTGRAMVDTYKDACLRKSLMVGVTPPRREWYPMPNGVDDQDEAVAGLERAIVSVDKCLRRVRQGFGVTSRTTALVGFSAGAVVALQVAAQSEHPFAAVVCHSGAVLEPDKLPYCKHQETTILLIHSEDDTCFYWEERYLPMREALKSKGYNVITLERRTGNHGLFKNDVIIAASFLAPILGYPADWQHPESHALPRSC